MSKTNHKYVKDKSQVCKRQITSIPVANRKNESHGSQVFQGQTASISPDIFASILPERIASMLPERITSMIPIPQWITSMLADIISGILTK